MMKLKNLLIAGVAGLTVAGSVSSVFAADVIDIPEPVIPEVVVQPSPVGGWYLRGDIGYSAPKFKGADYSTIGTGCDKCGGTIGVLNEHSLDGKLKGSFLLGGGVGYQVTDYFRTDLTLDYMTRSKFTSDRDESRLNALSLLANAYVDLGNFNGFTPYVGAGIGGTRVKWSDVVDTTNGGVLPGAANWRFTWALMAGASYDLTESLKLDAGYRFRRINGGKMFDGVDQVAAGFDKSFDVHDVRVGLRYQFGGYARPASYNDMNTPVYK
jgi:opacity protein-like surface antigen